MDVGQLVTIKLLNALNNANTNNKSQFNSNFDLFDLILENAIGNVPINNCNCNCHCDNNHSENSLDSLETLQSTMNNNKINNYNKTDNEINSKNLSLNSAESIKPNNISSSGNMDKAVSLIESKIGNKYVWGATGPNSFDCSGLVQYVYKNALGKDIPRTSYEQSKFGKAVDKKDLQVGDLVFFDTMGKGRVSHVGMYVGNNEFVHAANEKAGIKKSKLTGYYETHYKGARRP
ncbi:C40 family peptidase [Paraclostridium ghonii]|uniref:C40 family peptidase n=1 Tax=Paraclostridium ghonii TaxID=29358 RepID=UPI00202CC51D|nr:C40 family peptidase [Paeniclostridium ghonii]MCM0166726.1 C40 family peptidase [Paeniclostridium ghonii]